MKEIRAENVKVNGARRIPPPRENEQPDEQIQQADDSEIVLQRKAAYQRES